MDTPRQQAAAIFAFEHYRVTNLFGRDGLQYISVQHAFRDWMRAVLLEQLPLDVELANRARGLCACGARLSMSVKNETLCWKCRETLLGDLAA